MRNFPQIQPIAISDLKPYPNSPRNHPAAKLRKLRSSISRYGIIVPLIVDAENTIVDGHARLAVARDLDHTHVPTISVANWPALDVKAMRLALNRLAEGAIWDPVALRAEFQSLIDANFELDLTGFDTVEIETYLEIESPAAGEIEEVDASCLRTAPPISQPGDVWVLPGSQGDHRIGCGDFRDDELRQRLFGQEQAHIAFSDPPYNVPIAGNVSGLGKTTHEEFAMASGEMSTAEFQTFLYASFLTATCHLRAGSLIFCCIDWRGVGTLLAAAEQMELDLINIAVWVKTNPGMGSFYRSQHELIVVLKKKGAPHRNNVALGQFGRSRSNVWPYRGVNVFGPDRKWLNEHPTVKPSAMVADILRDASRPGDIVFDPFLGSGTSVIAAERTRRRCFGIEIEPRFVDLAIRRWQLETGRSAIRDHHGTTFKQNRQLASTAVMLIEASPKGGPK